MAKKIVFKMPSFKTCIGLSMCGVSWTCLEIQLLFSQALRVFVCVCVCLCVFVCVCVCMFCKETKLNWS